jgi:hypothetical protein
LLPSRALNRQLYQFDQANEPAIASVEPNGIAELRLTSA